MAGPFLWSITVLAARDTARAMSQENVEIVREVWNAYSRGDLDRIGELKPHGSKKVSEDRLSTRQGRCRSG